MTARRLLWGAGLVGVLLFLIYYTEYLSFFVCVLWVALPVCSGLLFLPLRGKVQVRLRAKDATVPAGETAEWLLDFENRSHLPAGPIWVRWTCEDVLTGEHVRKKAVFPAARGSWQIALRVEAPYCGRLLCRLERVRVCDVTGLFSLSCRIAGEKSADTFSLPPLQAVDILPPLRREESESGEYDRYRPGTDRTEPFGVREYRPGDPPRSIHWKLSEKRGELLVREGSLPLPEGPAVVVDLCEAPPEDLDTAAQAALLLSISLVSAGVRHRLFWHDRTLWQAEIENEDTWAQAAGQLLRTPPQEKPLAAAAVAAQAPVLYVSTNAAGAALLPEGSTVFLCGEGPFPAGTGIRVPAGSAAEAVAAALAEA